MHSAVAREAAVSPSYLAPLTAMNVLYVQGATGEEQSSVVAHQIRATCAILRGSGEVRKLFADNIGYRVICEGVKHSGVFTDEVLIEFINLATEQSGMTVHYTQVSQHSYTSLNDLALYGITVCANSTC